MNRSTLVPVTLLAISASLSGQAPLQLTAKETLNHIGETATVCGKVVSYGCRPGNVATFSLDLPAPAQVFSFEIDRRPFAPDPETRFFGQPICVTGRIDRVRAGAAIAVTDPDQ